MYGLEGKKNTYRIKKSKHVFWQKIEIYSGLYSLLLKEYGL